jgi:hypothetical protein
VLFDEFLFTSCVRIVALYCIFFGNIWLASLVFITPTFRDNVTPFLYSYREEYLQSIVNREGVKGVRAVLSPTGPVRQRDSGHGDNNEDGKG